MMIQIASSDFGDKVIIWAGMIFILILLIIIGMSLGIGFAELLFFDGDFTTGFTMTMKAIGKLFSHCFGLCS